jgi:endoribonuclease LACTB2
MLNFSNHNTSCFFLRAAGLPWLLAIDAGWPCTLFEYARHMKSIGCALEEIRWAVVTHFHMDHAGLVSELLSRGVTCFVFENQLEAIDAMERTIGKNYASYRTIDREKLVRVSLREAQGLFRGIGVSARVVRTDYHSTDSISFITGEGDAVVGDLPPLENAMPGDRRLRENWAALQESGARRAWPAHAPAFYSLAPMTDNRSTRR